MSTNKMKQIAVAMPIYKKNSKKQPEDIVGMKIFPLDPNSPTPRADFNATAFLIWTSNLKGLTLAGLTAPVYESVPYKRQ